MKSIHVMPKSKSIEAVVELLTLLGRPITPLPESISIRDAMLVLGPKKDTYYLVTPETCSCPSRFYRPGKPCKHQRKYFKDNIERVAAKIDDAMDSIKPILKWPSGHSGF
jgi:hypothetical protein